jgi:hypothetical protein
VRTSGQGHQGYAADVALGVNAPAPRLRVVAEGDAAAQDRANAVALLRELMDRTPKSAASPP